DLRIARQFHVTERLRAEILGEAFNVLNRANYNGYNSTRVQYGRDHHDHDAERPHHHDRELELPGREQ
ncbi:MAG TPA: hypothetical protein VNV86_03860, partial [Candidatus Acidoferrum sp.]|nr:hypothetical protein [Candidatus Acidoferrum sp.]